MTPSSRDSWMKSSAAHENWPWSWYSSRVRWSRRTIRDGAFQIWVHSTFGDIVPDQALHDEEAVVIRGTSGLVLLEEAWVSTQRVKEAKDFKWRYDRHNTGPLDSRTLPIVKVH